MANEDRELKLYRLRAEEARERAKAAKTEDARVSWIKIAEGYEELASIRSGMHKLKK